MGSARPDESVYLSQSNPYRPAILNLADSRAYLERIGLEADWATQQPSIDLLTKLSVAHHLSVPFDTSALHVPLDAWSKRDASRLGMRHGPGMQLGEPNFERIVSRRHGGFCYALNPLFASLLRGFGFRVSEVAARVYLHRGKDPQEAGYLWSCNTHVALIVDWRDSNARYLVDVGFGGGGPPYPIQLQDAATAPSLSTCESFMLREQQMPVDDTAAFPDPPMGWTLYRRVVPVGAAIPDHTAAESVPDSYWTPCIHFSLATMAPEDTLMGNLFNCTSENAAFTNVFVVSRLLPNGGRQTLCRGIPAVDASAPQDGTSYAKLYTKDSLKGEEYDIAWIPFDNRSIGRVLEENFGFSLELRQP
ncbi:hypothetical protein BMF94_6764 [Rhodotorula taiwanensis]|uniref:Uncharacterized protein n=1 Tax=Rhodotorula taiwanensis TaxID=741276 RepID=A0A2S5B0I4_9BASI|nr:hypothetical protein BMF94_6764 [Rhodotorula taiwanensis]